MEESKIKGKLVISILAIIVLLLIIGGLCWYIAIKGNNNDNLAKYNNVGSQNEQMLSSSIGQVDNESNNQNNETNNITENSYKLYQQNYKILIESLPKEDNYNIRIYAYPSTDVIPKILCAYVDNYGDAYINISDKSVLYKKYGETYKVASNVVDVAFGSAGQLGGIYQYIALLNQDGTVSVIMAGGGEGEFAEISEIIVKDVPNVNNIVKIISGTYGSNYGGAGYTAGIDINGNVIDIDLLELLDWDEIPKAPRQ